MKVESEDDRPVRSRKRLCHRDSVPASGSKRMSSAQKLQEVEKIVEELKEKHAASYDIEKLNAWAHLLHMGKHETPSNLPYFGKGGGGMKDKRKSQKTQPVEISSSPSKRLGLCGECIEQLSKWHTLLEKGAISVQQYDELKEQ